jgi:hypothetical protein
MTLRKQKIIYSSLGLHFFLFLKKYKSRKDKINVIFFVYNCCKINLTSQNEREENENRNELTKKLSDLIDILIN